ncbi:BTB/POZ domain-containing protein 6-like [Ylistrum balloti]|uniref:BTB/POZ domain-containing protein 6-like n=1 Tax=Ylistrum balloti TaxID=509963 RepID=UPI002905D709|nr:BTB/POZ domain-containing protein 6-like [Ylistrum balloti]
MASSPELDWQCNKSLVQCLEYLFTSGLACDVTFIVGECRTRISAHRTILVCRSPVFYAMLEGSLAEKGEIIIPDISKKSFSLLLGYLYTDEIQLTVTTVMSVLSAARKYCVDQLVKICEEFLKSNISVENACLLLEQSYMFMEEKLETDCLRFIHDSREKVLQTSGFLELSDACVKSITESDNLAVNESTVYEALIRWSEAESCRQGLQLNDNNRRDVLGDILYTVRFPLMDATYFAREISFRDILTSEEISRIYRIGKNDMFNSHNFNIKRRHKPKPKRGQFDSISRFSRTRRARRYIWNSRSGSDSISFKSSEHVYFHGLLTYGAHEGSEKITIGVYREGGNTVYRGSHEITRSTYCKVVFDDVISVDHGETIDVVIHGGIHATAYGLDGKSRVEYQNALITFSNSTLYPCVCTNTSRGQIPGLLLSL